MTTRKEIYERIADLGDTSLSALLAQIERFKRRRQGVSPEFWATLDEVHDRNRDLGEDDALALAAEAVGWARRSRNP